MSNILYLHPVRTENITSISIVQLPTRKTAIIRDYSESEPTIDDVSFSSSDITAYNWRTIPHNWDMISDKPINEYEPILNWRVNPNPSIDRVNMAVIMARLKAHYDKSQFKTVVACLMEDFIIWYDGESVHYDNYDSNPLKYALQTPIKRLTAETLLNRKKRYEKMVKIFDEIKDKIPNANMDDCLTAYELFKTEISKKCPTRATLSEFKKSCQKYIKAVIEERTKGQKPRYNPPEMALQEAKYRKLYWDTLKAHQRLKTH